MWAAISPVSKQTETQVQRTDQKHHGAKCTLGTEHIGVLRDIVLIELFFVLVRKQKIWQNQYPYLKSEDQT